MFYSALEPRGGSCRAVVAKVHRSRVVIRRANSKQRVSSSDQPHDSSSKKIVQFENHPEPVKNPKGLVANSLQEICAPFSAGKNRLTRTELQTDESLYNSQHSPFCHTLHGRTDLVHPDRSLSHVGRCGSRRLSAFRTDPSTAHHLGGHARDAGRACACHLLPLQLPDSHSRFRRLCRIRNSARSLGNHILFVSPVSQRVIAGL